MIWLNISWNKILCWKVFKYVLPLLQVLIYFLLGSIYNYGRAALLWSSIKAYCESKCLSKHHERDLASQALSSRKYLNTC